MTRVYLAILPLLLVVTPAAAQKNAPGPSAAPALPQPPSVAEVEARAKATYPEECWAFIDQEAAVYDEETQVFDLTYRYEYDEAAQPDRHFTLYKVFCGAGAYNLIHIYFTWEADWGLKPVTFAEPSLDVRYKGENDFLDADVESIAIDGWLSNPTLVNSTFDPATGSIRSDSHWRGLADASSQGVWVQEETRFVLKTYDVDASYDGEINPQRIVDYAPTN